MSEECDEIVQLVKRTENYPCLFNYNRRDYSNETVETAAWNEINISGN